MPETDLLHPYGNDCDRFLYAPVGEDRNGYVVTVLSTLARLGLDPRKEASELATLSRAAASKRLDRLLSGFRDVPALGTEHVSTAERLVLLLPEHLRLRASAPRGTKPTQKAPGPGLSVFQALMLLLVFAQILYFFLSGSGE